MTCFHMIEDKELGLKIAETNEEALWFKVVEEISATVKNLGQTLEIQSFLLSACKAKLLEIQGKPK